MWTWLPEPGRGEKKQKRMLNPAHQEKVEQATAQLQEMQEMQEQMGENGHEAIQDLGLMDTLGKVPYSIKQLYVSKDEVRLSISETFNVAR